MPQQKALEPSQGSGFTSATLFFYYTLFSGKNQMGSMMAEGCEYTFGKVSVHIELKSAAVNFGALVLI
jgi:hypothetical protein